MSHEQSQAPSLFPAFFPDPPKPARPANETGPVAVLRDWLLERGYVDLLDASASALYVDVRSKGAPPGLLSQVFEQILQGSFQATDIAKTLHIKYPLARARRLRPQDIDAGIQSHLLGLRLADRWGLPFHRVTTHICPHAVRGAQDVALLTSLDRITAKRSELSGHRVPDTRICFVGSLWRPDKLPKGWAWSGHKRWISHRIALSPSDVSSSPDATPGTEGS